MIDQLTIDKVQDTAQILDVVGEFVSLRRRGQNYVGLCPFHSDKNPSFYVSPSKNVCKCFSCGEGGGPVQFVMKHEQMSFYEAIKWLGNKYGIEVEEKKMTDEERARQTAREGMLMVNDFAQKTFEDDLFESGEGQSIGLPYFRERGLQDETIKRFHLGYALDSKYDFATRALAKGYKRDFLLDPNETNPVGVGLCYGGENDRTPVCRFHGRVIFPYHSLSGKPVAFGGRILQRVDHAFKKYVNSPESALYHKSDLLYGIFQAKGEIAKQDKCYIVEGNVDVLTMSQAGFENVVASAGTALTTNQIRIIKRFTKNVTLMYDGDAPGIAAALKTIDLLLLEGMNVKLILFPDGDDPDSFCRKYSTDQIRKYFEENEQDFVAFKANIMLQGNAKFDPTKRAQITQNIVQSLALINDPIYFSLFTHEASQILGVAEPAIMKSIETARANNYAAEVRKYEIEQRRKMAQQQKEETGVEGVFDVSGFKFQVSENEPEAETMQSETMQSESKQPETWNLKPETAQPEAARKSLPTDRFERNIIRNVIRHGGKCFDFKWQEEDGQMMSERWRVIDYFGYVLQQDEIEFQHPLYNKVLQIAFDATVDPQAPFDSVKFFTNHTDPEVSKLALELESDRYDALGIAQNIEDLDVVIPRSMLELQECIVRMQIDECKQKLRTPSPDTDIMAVMTRLNELYAIKKEFDRELGERIVTI